MASAKITQDEADRLLKMLKYALISEINFPTKGESIEFNVVERPSVNFEPELI